MQHSAQNFESIGINQELFNLKNNFFLTYF